MDLVLFVLSFFIILAGCEFFTNGVEWAGKRFKLTESAVGSLLAAVGTAMAETILPLVAILLLGGSAGRISAWARYSDPHLRYRRSPFFYAGWRLRPSQRTEKPG
jgi:hypothetical protein